MGTVPLWGGRGGPMGSFPPTAAPQANSITSTTKGEPVAGCAQSLAGKQKAKHPQGLPDMLI